MCTLNDEKYKLEFPFMDASFRRRSWESWQSDCSQRHVTHRERNASGARDAVTDRDATRVAIGVALCDLVLGSLRNEWEGGGQEQSETQRKEIKSLAPTCQDENRRDKKLEVARTSAIE